MRLLLGLIMSTVDVTTQTKQEYTVPYNVCGCRETHFNLQSAIRNIAVYFSWLLQHQRADIISEPDGNTIGRSSRWSSIHWKQQVCTAAEDERRKQKEGETDFETDNTNETADVETKHRIRQ